LLVSEENASTGTGYITKNISYDRVKKSLDRDFSLTKLAQNFHDLCAITYPVIVGLETNYVSCQNVGDVYIISSLYQSDGNITSAFGYRLSAGMDYYFNTMEFDNLSVKNFHAKDSYLTNCQVDNLCVDELTTNNLCVVQSAFFDSTTIFKQPIIINGKTLDSAYRIYETEITEQNSIDISADTINVLYLTNNTRFGSGTTNDLDIVIKGVSSDMALDSELLIHKTNSFIQNPPNNTPVVNLHFKMDDGEGSYEPNVDFISPNFMSCDDSGQITDDTNLEILNDNDEATYLYLISQITKKEPVLGSPRFYISRQYLNSIRT